MKPYFQDEHVTIYHGSAFDLMPADASGLTIVTDPPYGVGFSYASYQDTPEAFDAIRRALTGWAATAEQMALFMSMRQLFTMPPPKWMLCWAKPGSCRRSAVGGFSEWEPILLYGKWRVANDCKILPDCVNHSTDAAQGHPCPKPIKLLTWLVGLTEGVVHDPFAGSGTTGRAAKDLNRKAVLYEIEERYCEIAASRMAQGVLDFGTANAAGQGREAYPAPACSTGGAS